MELTLSNPWGLFALLGIPAVIAIHFLQRRQKRFLTSTLFLVPERQVQERKGALFQFWRNSLAFWMQILAVLLMTWLLAAPRWIASDWRQEVVLIHDASISMRAYDSERMVAISEMVDSISRLTSRTEWVLLPTDAREGVEFRGMDADALLAACRAYVPSSGQHSFEQAYQLADELNREDKARVILLTDHIPESLPAGVECISIGRPVENVGFSGLAVERSGPELRWRASLRNYGVQARELTWRMERSGGLIYQASLTVPPRTTQVITSVFPEKGEGPLELIIPDDAFSPDNRIMFYPPEPKRMSYLVGGSDDFVQGMDLILRDLPPIGERRSEQVHMACVEVADAEQFPAAPSAPYSMQFREGGADERRIQGFYTAESHPLMEGLNWNALRYQPTAKEYTPGDEDLVLLWHEQLPLIVLSDASDLIFNFSPVQSNSLQLPAFIVLANRFLENCVAQLPLPSVENFEGAQSLGFEHLRLKPDDVFELWIGNQESPRRIAPGQVVRAPINAVSLRADLNASPLLRGAVHFVETSEADFQEAEEHNQLEAGNKELIKNNSEEDFLATVWLLLLGAVLLLGWHAAARGD